MIDYESMQAQINYGYMTIAQELTVPIAPVGESWLRAVDQYPDLILWQADGSHPSEEGTYLTACVFYAVIFHESPNGLAYPGGFIKRKCHGASIDCFKYSLEHSIGIGQTG